MSTDWLAGGDDLPVFSVLERPLKFIAPDSTVETKTYWKVSTDGSALELIYACGKGLVAFTKQKFLFDENGALVRAGLLDAASKMKSQECVVVRSPRDETKLSAGEAIGAIAALLAEFEKYRFSLGDYSSFSPKHAKRVEAAIQRLLRLMREHNDGKALDRFGCDMLAAICDKALGNLSAGRSHFERSPRPAEARVHLIGPLEVCFRLLYGESATTRFVWRDDLPTQQADGAFVRFVCAFFAEVGCPCSRNTVHSALVARRKKQGRSKARTSC